MNMRLSFFTLLVYSFLGKGIDTTAQSFSMTDLPETALINAKSIDGGDFDNDGDLDLLLQWYDATTVTWKAEIFRNTSSASVISFAATGIYLPYASGACRWIDLNNDGKLDFLASGFDGVQNFLRAYINESGAFTTLPISSDLATSIDWGDLDADGDNDLLITTATESFLLTRTDGKTFSRLVPNTFSVNSILADYDLDSDLDVIGDGIYSNRGDEFLSTHELFPTANGYDNLGSTYAVDLDGDGDRDLIRGEVEHARGTTNYFAVAYFNQQNIFSRVEVDAVDDFSGSRISPLGAYDFDNNGDVEIAYVEDGNTVKDFIRFFEVKSHRLTTILLPANSRFHYLGAHVIADFNGDQKLDILQTGSYINTQTSEVVSYAKAYRNLTAATNAKPSVPTNLDKTIEGTSVTLSWNKSTDAETPSASLTYNFYLRQGLDTVISAYATKTGKPRVSDSKGSFEANSFHLPNLSNNGSYQWAVQSKDAAGNYAAFSPENNFEYSGGNSEVNHLTTLTDQAVNYDPKNDQFILVGIQNGNVYGVLLDGKFGERKSSLKKLNQFSTACQSPKVAVDSGGNYLVSWIGDSLSLPTSLWGKFIKSDLSFPQADEWRACEKLFYGSSTGTTIVSHDARYNPARNSFDLGWAFLGETGGASVRRARLQGNVAKLDPIKNITWTYVSGYLHGARGYRDISLDSDPTSGKSIAVYAFENERAEGGLTSLGKVYFQELDQNLVAVKDSVEAATFTTGSAPHILYNPYLRNFMVIWNAHSKIQISPLPQDGYNESRDVAAAILSFSPNGSLTIYIFPSKISKAQQQGGVGGTLDPNLSFNYDRNEFLVSWHNTNAGKLYGQRINPVDKTTVTVDEFQIKASLSESPKATFANLQNHFLLGFLQDGNGTTSIVDIPDDPVPQVVSLSKNKAYAGDKINITGNNFGKTPFLNSVYFGSIKAHVDTLLWDRTKIQVTVPTGLSRDKVPVVVSFDGQKSNATILFENITISGITSVVPVEGQPGDTITITGSNFPLDKNNFLVKFGPVVAALDDILDDNTETEIKVKVPQNAVRGSGQDINVIIQEIDNIFKGFRVIRIPSIESVASSDGPLEKLISNKRMDIAGINFSTNPDDLKKIRIGGNIVSPENIKSTSDTNVQIEIPSGIEGLHRIYILIDEVEAASPTEYDFILGAEVRSGVVDTVFRFSNRTNDILGLEVEVYNHETVQGVKFWTKGISAQETDWTSEPLTFNDGNRIKHVLEEAEFTDDPIGLEGYYEVVDASAIIKRSDTFRVFRDYIGSGETALIPDLRFGGNIQDYNIISIPYALTPNKINTVFKSILDVYGYDNTKWRIIHYKNEDGSVGYTEYLDGLDDIDPGKGYWIIVRNQQDIFFDMGRTLHTDTLYTDQGFYRYGPFEIVLNPGWNQIGNPYDFNVSWSDILEYNNNPQNLESFKTFKDGSFQTVDIINRFRGGFVRYNGTGQLALKIPFTQNTSINGGRKAEEKGIKSNLSEKEWRITLELSGGELKNKISYFGMHPKASDNEDERDEHRLPAFIQTLDISFPNSLSASIVGTNDHFSWEFEVLNTTDSKEITLRWDNSFFGENDRELFLQDKTDERLIDMRKENHYTFIYREGYTFKIHFGDKSYIEAMAKPSNVVLSDAYPNPMRSTTTIPFTVTKDKTHVHLGIYSLQGQEIQTLVNDNLAPGFYEFEWNGRGPGGEEITSGVLLYRLQASEAGSGVKSYFKKLVIAP